MTFQHFLCTVRADLMRYAGATHVGAFLRVHLVEPGFKYLTTMRLCRFLDGKRLLLPLLVLARLRLRRLRYRFGIDISYRTAVAPGFYIGHFGGIIVNSATVIGANCNISQNVTIGEAFRGAYPGCPTIGSDVYIGPGAVIVGGITIGDHAAIGANAVVLKPVPPHGVAAGVPARIVSERGSEGYINKRWTSPCP